MYKTENINNNLKELHIHRVLKFILTLTIIVSVMNICSWFLVKGGVNTTFHLITSMKFNTAVAFCLSAIIIFIYTRTLNLRSTYVIPLTTLLFIFCTIILLQYPLNFNLQIDELFIKDTEPTSLSKKMPPASAFCFTLLSIGFFLNIIRKNKYISQILFLAVTIISCISVVSYILRFPIDKKSMFFDSMSITTSILLTLLSFGACLINPNEGIMRFVLAKKIGSKLARSIFPWTILIPILLSTTFILLLKFSIITANSGIIIYTILLMFFSTFFLFNIAKNLNIAEEKRAKLNNLLIASNEELVQFKYALDQVANVAIFNEQGNIVYTNNRYAEFFQYSQAELLNSDQSIFKRSFYNHVDTLPTQNSLKKNRIWTAEISKLSKDKTKHCLDTAIVPYRGNNSEYNTYMGIFIDITKRKEAEQLLASEYVQELETKNKELEQFAYISSHDLQEPLRTISTSIAILENEYENDFSGETKQLIKFIQIASNRASMLVHGLLDYSRIGQNNKPVKVNIKKIIADSLLDLAMCVKESNTQLSYGALPTIVGYKLELKLLFQNLIYNSIKFRRPDVPPKIHIECQWIIDRWQFSVSDNGIGVSKEHFDRLFILFQKLHTQEDYDGLGLGLAHCTKIVGLHKGVIWAESTLGKGTTIYFTLKDV